MKRDDLCGGCVHPPIQSSAHSTGSNTVPVTVDTFVRAGPSTLAQLP